MSVLTLDHISVEWTKLPNCSSQV